MAWRIYFGVEVSGEDEQDAINNAVMAALEAGLHSIVTDVEEFDDEDLDEEE